jgi:orotidine-5'-phosphate decarboxylase
VGSGDFEDLELTNGRTLYEEVAYQASHTWNEHGNILLVVGATYPEEIARVRQVVGDDMFFLIPGIGAQ